MGDSGHNLHLCDHCGLPIAASGHQGQVAGVWQRFCCYGCYLCQRIIGERGESGLTSWLLAQLGLSWFFSMDIMMISVARYTGGFEGVDPRTVRFFEPGMDARMQARRLLEIDLRKALADSEFEVFFQPIVQLDPQEIIGFEALLRWRHPQRGIVEPAAFIPLAEETGLIAPIGEWVLRQACAEAVKWPEHFHIAVNLSPVQFKNRTLVQTVIAALAASGLAPQRLELEITESVLLQDEESTLATLHALREFGVRIAMDDFGTGYSSLGYLRSFPFDKIKIDQSFIKEVGSRSDSLAIVRAVTGLGTSLGIATTAEGVENLEQLERVKLEGCNEGQGFLFSPPVEAKELPALIEKHNRQRKVA